MFFLHLVFNEKSEKKLLLFFLLYSTFLLFYFGTGIRSSKMTFYKKTFLLKSGNVKFNITQTLDIMSPCSISIIWLQKRDLKLN